MRILFFCKPVRAEAFHCLCRAICPTTPGKSEPTFSTSDFSEGVYEFFGENDLEDGGVLFVVDAECPAFSQQVGLANVQFRPKLVVLGIVPNGPPLTGLADITMFSETWKFDSSDEWERHFQGVAKQLFFCK